MLKSKNKKLSVFYSLVICMLVTSSANAQKNGWQFLVSNKSKEQRQINSDFYNRFPGVFVDDVTEDQDVGKLKLNEGQKHQAIAWGLTEAQEKRYVLLMQNKSGSYYKETTLTPVEVLGINARTNKERAYYASLDAKQAFQRIAKEEAFDTAYHKAAVVLKDQFNLEIVNAFDYSKYSPYSYKPLDIQNNDKLMLFVGLTDSVKPVVSSLIDSIILNPTIQLNVYFVGQNVTKDKIFTWAMTQNIPPEMVNAKKITLNLDNGQLQKLNLPKTQRTKETKTPILILVHSGTSKTIDIGRF